MRNDQTAANVSQLAALLEDGPQVVLLVVLVLLYDAGEDLEGAGLFSILTSILNVLLKWWAANKEREAAPKKAYTLLLEDLTDSDDVRNIVLRFHKLDSGELKDLLDKVNDASKVKKVDFSDSKFDRCSDGDLKAFTKFLCDAGEPHSFLPCSKLRMIPMI